MEEGVNHIEESLLKTSHRIIIGDSRQMAGVRDESIHLVVTSPPYWQLKDYGEGNQIGFDQSYQEYINNLSLVWSECRRVLHKGCRLCVNVGDQFARSVYYGRYKVIPIRTEIIKFCEYAGFDYMGSIIWRKVTTCNTSGGAVVMGSYPYPRNGIIKIDYEFILIFKKPGKSPGVSKEVKEKSRLAKEEWNEYFAGHWNFPGIRQKGHLAMFPEELPRRLIKMFSFVGETVLDPFLGSGTTSLAARNLERNSIGYEINEDFIPIIEEKVVPGQLTFFEEANIQVERQLDLNADFRESIKKLPYIFKDPVKMDKKVDPRRRNFGSKIDKSNVRDKEYFSVKEVLSPETLILNDGRKIKLLGVREIADKREAAIRFIMEKTKGRKVLLKIDNLFSDGKNNNFCYLYLKNRTFINAHIIKNGLADVDTSRDYSCRSRFLSYAGKK